MHFLKKELPFFFFFFNPLNLLLERDLDEPCCLPCPVQVEGGTQGGGQEEVRAGLSHTHINPSPTPREGRGPAFPPTRGLCPNTSLSDTDFPSHWQPSLISSSRRHAVPTSRTLGRSTGKGISTAGCGAPRSLLLLPGGRHNQAKMPSSAHLLGLVYRGS